MSAEAKDMVQAQENLPTIQPSTPMDIIGRMVETGADVGQLEKMMDLQERWERNEGRKAFAAALSAFQADCPVIRKNMTGEKATYADLAFTVKTIKPFLNKHGLSVRFDTELTAPNGNPAIMTAICYVTHQSGHTETNQFSCPVDAGPVNRQGRKVMNSAQSTASARSYCKRYALGDALNLVFADEVDDDGESAASQPADPITDKTLVELRDMADGHEERTEFVDKHGEGMSEKRARSIIDQWKASE